MDMLWTQWKSSRIIWVSLWVSQIFSSSSHRIMEWPWQYSFPPFFTYVLCTTIAAYARCCCSTNVVWIRFTYLRSSFTHILSSSLTDITFFILFFAGVIILSSAIILLTWLAQCLRVVMLLTNLGFNHKRTREESSWRHGRR